MGSVKTLLMIISSLTCLGVFRHALDCKHPACYEEAATDLGGSWDSRESARTEPCRENDIGRTVCMRQRTSLPKL